MVDDSAETVQAGVLVAGIAQGFPGELDVAQIHAGLGVGPFDHAAEAEVAEGFQGIGRIAQRTQPGDVGIQPQSVVVVDGVAGSVGNRGQPTVIGPTGHLTVGVLDPG